jgi:excisionase family DNA binding protein
MADGRESIQALATVTLDARTLESLGPQTLERLAELVAARMASRVPGVARRWVSVDEVAGLGGLSRSLVYREIERGHLAAYKVGSRLRIELEAVAAWKERCRVRPRSEPPVYEPAMRGRRGVASASFVDDLDAIEREAGRAA